ncbi:hypothetical protein TELCIR_06188 [Teladorsagia circumcincta]|uniref:Uncharacterized protein n=1 Tax=Teladorsagia circumcincta TaxID=45464 RepID=A0A2G9UNM4_TELCI|nr:hypothetical protein TELCIR_06188 [Teladorsagia circumcincta]
MHVALVGMTGSGKSAIAVKYITKRFIGEYDSSLEYPNRYKKSIASFVLLRLRDRHTEEIGFLSPPFNKSIRSSAIQSSEAGAIAQDAEFEQNQNGQQVAEVVS